jgi:hypothetical protein
MRNKDLVRLEKKAPSFGFIELLVREFGLAKAPVGDSHFTDVERSNAIPSVFDMGNGF